MPTFQYSARDRAGQTQAGVLAARDVTEARQTLRNRELFLTGIRQQESRDTTPRPGLFGPRKVRLKDMVVMSRQLATLVRSGISLFESLHAVEAQTQNPCLAGLLNKLRYDVLTGSSLAEAMRKHPAVLSESYVSLVQAGETGGLLEQTLEIAAEQFDREAELREKIKSALVYPAVVLTALVGLVLFMLVFIIPVFAKVYEQFHAHLPAITQALVQLSDLLLHKAWLVVLILAGLIFGLRKAVRRPAGRRVFDRLKLQMPLLGALNRKVAVARFTQTFAGSVHAGVPILRALAIAADTSGNVIIMEAIQQVADFVKDGSTLTQPLEQTGQFPPMVTRMIAAGEESGNLDTMLTEITRFYNRDIEYTVANLTRVLEPVMTLLVGGVVLFVLLALYMPLFNLAQVLRQ